MLFHSPEFFAFLIAVLALFYAAPMRCCRIVLLAASYAFYMFWNAKFIVLIWTLTLIDYAAGLWMDRVSQKRRKLVLLVSLCANLGLLGFFKYYNFFASFAAAALGLPRNSSFIDVILPLGISFHTFQSMSYVIDVYRGEQEPIRNLLDYALFISFFPQLVAGPIVRAREFFGNLYHWRRPSMEEFQGASLLFLCGLAKKMMFADQFAKVADAYFEHVYANPGVVTAWTATVAFALQIFFDFSGYTDMAIACAKFLGFDLPENFARPYLAASITEFWRRWHISLSRWLRDYLYIPLGGNRKGPVRTYMNLFVTMLLGGLWHGANWTFIAWGAWHGSLLAAERACGLQTNRNSRWTMFTPVRAALTFALVVVGWVLFRAPGIREAAFVYGQMFFGRGGVSLLSPGHMMLIVFSLAFAIFEEKRSVLARFARLPVPVQAAALTVLLLCFEIFSVTDQRLPFIYFQF
jgi:alginate O-acetyltransferase complex protein AlgI